ncbi:hypothetical protein [Paenarthrobacter nitroguajacolicus]|uniref:hypothetical protein n=1 Tax=Paenarthrobacter nitroguajacolicus TaxID=211146 RepID=UPI00248D3343|nr:hypothetical protein [Paenarthrobacter nitroguajacolicus]MDI2034954.1 hypothetical protein [Paenarthrobacter nitroguajacolicus]
MARRSVQFWRFEQLNGEELSRPFPARRLAEVLKKAQEAGTDRHFTSVDGTVMLAQAVASSPYPVLLLDRVRDTNLPSVGDALGRRKALPLAPGDHLLETTYFAFLKRNVIAVLTSGNGPRASRMGEYLEGMLGLEPTLVPVVREDIEEILTRLEVSRFEFALPAERLSGKLMEGEWADVLDSASRLMNQGTFRISLSVGRTGSAEDKRRIRERIQRLIDLFRQAGSVEHFDYVVAEGKDSLTGDREVVDLLKERFISHVEVDPDLFNDPQKSTAEAISILNKQAMDNEAFFAKTLPDLRGTPDSSLVPDIVAGGMAAVRAALAAAVVNAGEAGQTAGEHQDGAGHELVRG